MNFEALAIDLMRRTERSVERVMQLAVDTGITFQVSDIVEAVEDELPADYPGPTTGLTRRDMISRMAQDVISGEAYADD